MSMVSFEIYLLCLFRESAFSTLWGKDAGQKAVKLCNAVKSAPEYALV